ncbi:LemA protein [Balneicella halophila]|uniref:LemA protein n=1 Tax=Balneicella halophila TaxID=1537566 RepID=A0A7L4URD0_BALHA|nr:LemA family protein [Balneicella halophila]PVX51787.1 LemA protein [Balneicella halophila]
MKLLRNLLLIVLIIPFFSSCGYNTMVNKEETVESQWANVQDAYQRRADLIPNLVNTVKGYAEHEQETFKEVIEARSKATSTTIDAGNLDADKLAQFQQAQQGLSGALSKLMVVVEKYPDLKANTNFLALQDQLEGTENRISTERRRFNEAAKEYNQYTRNFPQNIVAMIFGFDKKPYFEAQAGSDRAPEVEF